MHFRHSSPYRHSTASLAWVISITTALSGVLLSPEAFAQGKAATTQSANPGSIASIKAPPLPNGSAQVIVKPGMSNAEWHKAYKEGGRPPFDRKEVKRIGGDVERD